MKRCILFILLLLAILCWLNSGDRKLARRVTARVAHDHGERATADEVGEIFS